MVNGRLWSILMSHRNQRRSLLRARAIAEMIAVFEYSIKPQTSGLSSRNCWIKFRELVLVQKYALPND
jgi:hypothetical protein